MSLLHKILSTQVNWKKLTETESNIAKKCDRRTLKINEKVWCTIGVLT
jgi:hypothetical protein